MENLEKYKADSDKRFEPHIMVIKDNKNLAIVDKNRLLSQPSPKSYPNSNLGLAGQHNWS